MKEVGYPKAELKTLTDALAMLGATENAIVLYLASFQTGRTTALSPNV